MSGFFALSCHIYSYASRGVVTDARSPTPTAKPRKLPPARGECTTHLFLGQAMSIMCGAQRRISLACTTDVSQRFLTLGSGGLYYAAPEMRMAAPPMSPVYSAQPQPTPVLAYPDGRRPRVLHRNGAPAGDCCCCDPYCCDRCCQEWCDNCCDTFCYRCCW